MANNQIISEKDYTEILQQAVSTITSARVTIAKQFNTATSGVYWSIGKLLFEKQLSEGYGSGVVKQLSVDLKLVFPDMGLSPRNLWDMKRYYERYYQTNDKLRQAVAVLPWGHNLLLLNKVESFAAIEFYATEAFHKGSH